MEYYKLINEHDNERAFKRAEKILNKPLDNNDSEFIKNRHYVDCSNYETALEHFELAGDTEDFGLINRITKSVEEIEIKAE